MIHHLYFRKVEAESALDDAEDVLRLFAVGFACAVAFIGLLANFYVG